MEKVYKSSQLSLKVSRIHTTPIRHNTKLAALKPLSICADDRKVSITGSFFILSSKQNGPEQDDHHETYRLAREGLIHYMNGADRYNFKWEFTLVLAGDRSRAVALWEALCDVERHFGENPAHMHTKKRH